MPRCAPPRSTESSTGPTTAVGCSSARITRAHPRRSARACSGCRRTWLALPETGRPRCTRSPSRAATRAIRRSSPSSTRRSASSWTAACASPISTRSRASCPRGPVSDRVNLELATRALARSDSAKARAALDRLPSQLSEADAATRDRLLARASDRAGGGEATLGVVLPLSGPYAKIGESILRGIALGSGIYAELALASAAARPRFGRRCRDCGRGHARAHRFRRRRDLRPGALERGGRGGADRGVRAGAAAQLRAPRRRGRSGRVRVPPRAHARRSGLRARALLRGAARLPALRDPVPGRRVRHELQEPLLGGDRSATAAASWRSRATRRAPSTGRSRSS